MNDFKEKISSEATIYENVTLGKNVTISKGVILYPNVYIDDDTYIGPYCIIGEPSIDYYGNDKYVFKKTRIGKGSIIRSNTIIYENVLIGDNFQTGHHVTIREKTIIGNNCSIGTFSDLQGFLELGNFVRLHSNVHIGQLTKIEDYVWIYPYVVTTNDPYPPMGKLVGTTIKKYAQIATGSIILPGKVIGENALVGAGSVLTKNVPDYALFVGVPAQNKGSVTEIKDDNNNPVYPWREHLKSYRGYPWQMKGEIKK